MRDRSGMGGEGDDSLVAHEAFAQQRELVLAFAQRCRQPRGEHQHHHAGQQEVRRRAPQVQVHRIVVAALQRQPEHRAQGIAADAGRGDGVGPAQRQRQCRQCDQDQEQRAERIGDAAAPTHHPGQDRDIDQDVAERGDRRRVAVVYPQLCVQVEQGQHEDAAP
ncbi:hypothetical protein D3C71_1251760 [compost metagenome]